MQHQQTRTPLRHERGVIYVPRTGSRLDQAIAPGSGIVGFPSRGATKIVLYYEGNLYDAENLRDPEERIVSAFGRGATGYPTSAMTGVLDDDLFDLIRVGEVQWPSIIRWDSPASAQVFLEYASRYQGKIPTSNRQGVSGLSVIEIDMTSILGQYDNPSDFEEWRWIEAMARFEHVANNVEAGVFEFMLKVPTEEEEEGYESPPPAKIKAIIHLARQMHAHRILFHQG